MAIGGFVLGALVLAIATILLFSSEALFRSKIPMVSYFPGTIQGLRVGSSVEFQGVQVGQVTGIELDYWPSEARFLIPVYYEVWPEALNVREGEAGDGHMSGDEYSRLVIDEGLRAQLEAVSLVTGQFLISLGLHPDTPATLLGQDSNRVEVPAIEATRDRIASMLEGLRLNELVDSGIGTFEALSSLLQDEGLAGLAAEAKSLVVDIRRLTKDLDDVVEPLVGRVDQTLKDYSLLAQTLGERATALADNIENTSTEFSQLSQRVEARVDPLADSAQRAVDDAGRVMRSAEGLLAEDSAQRHNLDLLLEEAASAARSLRLLADFIEQNPDALIRGRYQ
jgi:paraquat-inducible protein B